MNKSILILIFSCFVIALKAQQTVSENFSFNHQKRFSQRSDYFILNNENLSLKNLTYSLIHTKKTTYFNLISSSGNAFTLLVPEARCLSYNPQSNLLLFAHRGNPTAGIGKSISSIVNSISTDKGMKWKDIIVTGDTSKHNRYPSGVIFNPDGNTDYKNAYSVFCGPVTNDKEWVANYFGSAKLDSSNFNYQYTLISKTFPQLFPRNGFTICKDSIAHVLGYSVDTNKAGDVINLTVFMNNGKFNPVTKIFDWKTVSTKHSFYHNKNGAILYSSFNTAWSNDGNTGYIYFIGIDSITNFKTYQPIVYKSIDKGNTWKLLPIYNFKNDKSLTKYIGHIKTDTSIRKPMFNYESYNAVVDAKGQLHIASVINSGLTENSDSLGYYYGLNLFFDVYTKTDSTWNADPIALILTDPVEAADNIFGSGTDAQSWDHRIQISKNQSEDKLFFVWTDSDTTLCSKSAVHKLYYINDIPNLYIYGKDILTGNKTGIVSITDNSSIAYLAYWHFVSENCISDSGKYTIPISISPINDIHSGFSDDPTKPIRHFYLTDITFTDNNFVTNPGIKEYNHSEILSVSQNNPNPFSTSTDIKILLSRPSDVSLEIVNLTGQHVYTKSYGTLSASTHTLNFNRENIPSGIYFYSIKTGGDCITKKMIVE